MFPHPVWCLPVCGVSRCVVCPRLTVVHSTASRCIPEHRTQCIPTAPGGLVKPPCMCVCARCLPTPCGVPRCPPLHPSYPSRSQAHLATEALTSDFRCLGSSKEACESGECHSPQLFRSRSLSLAPLTLMSSIPYRCRGGGLEQEASQPCPSTDTCSQALQRVHVRLEQEASQPCLSRLH